MSSPNVPEPVPDTLDEKEEESIETVAPLIRIAPPSAVVEDVTTPPPVVLFPEKEQFEIEKTTFEKTLKRVQKLSPSKMAKNTGYSRNLNEIKRGNIS